MTILLKAVGKVLNLIFRAWLKVTKVPIVHLGTDYGGWYIPENFLTDKSTCYLVGVGEDISFDLALVNSYRCNVVLIDPTPKSKTHVEELLSQRPDEQGQISYQNGQALQRVPEALLHKIKYLDIGLWSCPKEIRFYAPKNADHVSHSIVNLQKTENYFVAKVDRLVNIMEGLGHKYIDLLKIDIEGAEYEVINDLYLSKTQVNALCVEFDEVTQPKNIFYIARIYKAHIKLKKMGFELIHCSKKLNMSYLRQS